MIAFAKRCTKELLRDPLNILFGLGFPVVLLLLLSMIQTNIPAELFVIERLAPGITVFGLSFMTLFSATLIARDRESAFLQRLYTTPLKSADFILGYMLPVLPMAAAQCAVSYLVAIFLGLPVTVNLLYAILLILPIAGLYISLGLLCGSLLNIKQVGGVCGALLTNLSAWFSGVWFDLELVGGVFVKIAYCLPFVHAVEAERSIICGDFAAVLPHLAIVLAYAVGITVLAITLFLRQMNQQ